MGTLTTMTPEDMGEGTPYQWTVCRPGFTSPPAEECCKDVTQATCVVTRVVKGRLAYQVKAISRAKLVRIFDYVMMAVAAFRK
jgi:hypothetical protein